MNYRRTAEILNMTQPGVTQHIQYLEKQYGVKLFTYKKHTLERTEEAEMLMRCLNSVMAEEQSLCTAFAKPKKQLLRVGATKTIGEFVLVDTVKKFLADPSHNLEFTIDNTRRLLQMLENREIDFAVIEGIVDKSRYGCRLYRKNDFVGVCSVKHRFAGKEVQIEDIFDETLIVREKGSGTRNLLERAMADRGFSLDNFARTVSISNFSVIMELLRDGGITFAYSPIAEQKKDLTTFSVKDMKIAGEFNFVYCSEAAAEEKIRLFLGKPQKAAENR